MRNKRCYGSPDLIVEVLSPSTARNDRLLKRNYYEKAGVKEYLIIDPHNKSIEKYIPQSESYHLEEIFDLENHLFQSTLLHDIKLSLDDIFSFMD